MTLNNLPFIKSRQKYSIKSDKEIKIKELSKVFLPKVNLIYSLVQNTTI